VSVGCVSGVCEWGVGCAGCGVCGVCVGAFTKCSGTYL
jgi:hypothetical protein